MFVGHGNKSCEKPFNTANKQGMRKSTSGLLKQKIDRVVLCRHKRTTDIALIFIDVSTLELETENLGIKGHHAIIIEV